MDDVIRRWHLNLAKEAAERGNKYFHVCYQMSASNSWKTAEEFIQPGMYFQTMHFTLKGAEEYAREFSSAIEHCIYKVMWGDIPLSLWANGECLYNAFKGDK